MNMNPVPVGHVEIFMNLVNVGCFRFLVFAGINKILVSRPSLEMVIFLSKLNYCYLSTS